MNDESRGTWERKAVFYFKPGGNQDKSEQKEPVTRRNSNRAPLERKSGALPLWQLALCSLALCYSPS
jgi:hypothetical protein